MSSALLEALLQQRNKPAGKNHVELTARQPMDQLIALVLGRVLDHNPAIVALECVVQIAERKNIIYIDPAVVGAVCELEAQDAEVRKILPVNAGKALRDNNPQPHEAGRDRGVLSARALPVVFSSDDYVSTIVLEFLGLLRIAFVNLVENELGNFGNVAAVGQHA